jgi:hypothetical protein
MAEVFLLLFIVQVGILDSRTARADKEPVSILAARIGGHIHPSICQAKDGTLVVVGRNRRSSGRFGRA